MANIFKLENFIHFIAIKEECDKMGKVFISHTKKDKEFCDDFDRIVARVGIPAFRSEHEKIKKPAWKTINYKINPIFRTLIL